MSTPTPSTKILRSPLLAVFIALVFVAGPMPGPTDLVESAVAQSTTGLQVTKADYQTEVDDVFGEQAYAYVVLTNPSEDKTEQRDVVKGVTVKSTTNTTAFKIDLLETGPETGVFVGGFGFSQSTWTAPGKHPFLGRLGVDQNGIVRVKDGDTVTVTAPGGSATFKWHDAMAAIPSFTPDPGPIFGTATSIAIRIWDDDLHVSSGVDTHDDVLFVSSDSDPEGKFLALTQTSATSGNFTASFELRTSATGAANSIFVRPGDQVTATLHEEHDNEGLRRVVDIGTWTFHPATNGQVVLNRATYVGPTQLGVETGLDRAVVTVIDGDRNQAATADSFTVQACRETPGGSQRACEPMILTQLPGTVVGQPTAFVGTLAFNCASCAGEPDGDPSIAANLDLDTGDTVRIKYDDAPDRNGVTTPRTATAVWRDAGTAEINLGSGGSIVRGVADLVSIELIDADSNGVPNARETIRVTARSDTNPTGIAVDLLETNANSGRFTGTIGFTTSGTSGRLGVTDGDLITVHYADPVNDDGRPEMVAANGGNAMFWRAATDPTVFTDATKYYRANTTADIMTTADVFVEDPSRNDPTKRDNIIVGAFAGSDQATITLLEVGVDSGLFHGVLGFDTTPDTEGKLHIGSTGETDFVIEYEGASSGTRTFVHAPAAADAVLRAEDRFDGAPRAASRVIVDVDAQDTTTEFEIAVYAPTTAGPLTVVLESARCNSSSGPSGRTDESRSVALTADGGDSGRFNATFSITAYEADESICEAGNSEEDTFLAVDIGQNFWMNVTVNGNARSTVVGTQERATETGTILDAAGGTAIDDISGVNNRAFFDISGGSHNFDSGSRQVIRVSAEASSFDGTTPTATELVAVETAPDSGIFRGSFTFNNQDNSTLGNEQALYVKGHDSITRQGQNVGYQMYSGIALLGDGDKVLDGLSWWASGAASLDVERPAFGSQGFRVNLMDQDAFPARATETSAVSSGQRSYAFGGAGFVKGSEFVYYSDLSVEWEEDSTGSDGKKVTVHARGLEPVVDRNGDGVVGCSDVTLTGTKKSNPISNAEELGPNDITCKLVSENEITFDFRNSAGTVTCSHQAAEVGEKCTATVTYDALTQDQASCPAGASFMDYTYVTTNGRHTGIRFCADPDEADLRFEYLRDSRTIKVQSLDGATPLETEDVTLMYDSGSLFSATIPIETTAGAGNGQLYVGSATTHAAVRFVYKDAVTGVDGRPGSDQYDHLRAVRALDQWRAAQSAAIKVMEPDYVAETPTPVRGPAVYVEVVDKDSDRTSSADTIVVNPLATSSGASPPEPLVLRESTATSGIFRGILDVADLGLESSGTIRFAFEDPHKANGEPQTISRSVPWRNAEDGSVLLYSDSQFTNSELQEHDLITGTLGKLYIAVQDSDANRASGVVEKINVRARSIYDPVGESIELTETEAGSGIFRSPGIGFSSTLVDGDGKIFTRDYTLDGDLIGNEVTVTYDDPTGTDGNRIVVASNKIGWDQLFDGIVDMDLAFYIGNNVDKASGHLAVAHITVSDGDLNSDPRAVDVITLGANGATIPGSSGSSYEFGRLDGGSLIGLPKLHALVETGANTGIFMAISAFKDGGAVVDESWPTGTYARVPMTNTGSMRFIYTDATPASGEAGSTTESLDTAQWYQAGYGVVGFDKSGYNKIDEPVVVRLYDTDLTTGPTLTATSEADSTGVSVPLTKKRTGVFQGSLDLTDTAGGTGLFVHDIDELTVRYSDASPPGTRVANTEIRINDFDPPITSIVTSPATPDGENDWFVTQPTISFSANEPATTFYRLDGGGTRLFQNTGFTVSEGVHEVEFWSVDSVDNEEEAQTTQVKFDATAPTTQVSNVTARSKPLGAIELSWGSVTGKTDPLQFGSYKVFQGTTANFVGNSTTESFSHTPGSDGTHTYLVAVADAAGNFDASKAVSVSGVSDRVAPRMLSASVSPTELFEEIDLNLTVTITGTVHESDLTDVDRVETSVLSPFGDGIANVTMSQQGTTNVWRGTFDDFPGISGEYVFKVAALDAAGNAAPENRTVFFHAIDREPPRVTVPETVVQGFPLSVEVKDNDKGIATISYRLNGAATVNVPVSDGPLTHTFTVPTASLSLGQHSLSINVADLNGTANFATYDVTFTVTDSDGTAPPGTGNAPVVSLLAKFVENGKNVRLGVQSAGPLTALTMAVDGGAAQSVLSSWAGSSSPTEVSIGALSAGKHTVTVTATNLADTATRTFEIYVLDVGVPLPPGDVQVTKGPDGFPKVTWAPSESNNVGGYLVHRSSSPYKVIGVVDAETTEYTDKTAKAGTTYKYAVTAYGLNQEGFLAKGSPSEAGVPWVLELEGSSFAVEDPDSKFWTVFWVILILLVVVSAVVLLVVYRERIFRPRGESGEIYDEDYPNESGTMTLPFGEEQHELRCPNCTTEFAVTGEKPIVTTCPNCGKKGILR